ncbi:Protein of unknown function [Alteribacillus persepolensis]|uniref:DUF3219 domain-containing protein n=1 Tax=Alteribacillus persepolensis TaxID=568899 RepID=A0A1G8JWU4_9BACI|nr:DUF3219 family protein [Alteribacillus persepolensis]SDI35712.1 Protein of unknown function [Alteribacillus persepolensis]
MNVYLNDTPISVKEYNEENDKGKQSIAIRFDVTSEDYHELTMLLYKAVFDIEVPERNTAFRGEIQQYAASITNLYEPGQTGEFFVRLQEVI